jgi:prepilin-type N-terminal cleavage/methylation domain-containing protein
VRLRAGQRGTTLVELLVVLALLGTIAVLTAQLVIQSTRLMHTTAEATRNPDLVLAGEWLRRDLFEATAVVGGALGWTDGPLVLIGQHGGWVAFAAVDGTLVRTGVPPGAVPADGRVVLRGVEGWRWRLDDGRLIRIELEANVNPNADRDPTGSGTVKPERRTDRLGFALRGASGGRSW